MIQRIVLVIAMGLLLQEASHAQEKKATLKDTLDNKLDFSDYVINMHGFVPWPTIISEPALGNFGAALALVFVSPKKQVEGKEKFRFPDITAVAGMYTLNDSWGGGLFRQGSFPKAGLRYTVAAAYGSINMNFYREGYFKQREVLFHFDLPFGMLDVSKNIFRNNIFLGLRYQYAWVKVSHDFDSLPGWFFDPHWESEKNLGILGVYTEWDNRNTIFTPDRGIRFKTTYFAARSWTISDFDVDRLEMFSTAFFNPVRWWVCGLKAEYMMVGDGAPFYYMPYLNLRGFPTMRYQGDKTLLFETEQRFDLNLRWSLVGFVGTGRTFSDSELTSDDAWHVAGGVGFRYLLARLLRMRMGVDVALGPDQFAYYIVLGHYWNR